jgi:transcriptional regulator with XRE-family HTH domain
MKLPTGRIIYRGNSLLKVYRETPMLLIQVARKHLGMTQNAFAKKLGINRSVLSRYETGQYMPRGDIIVRCLRLLGLDLVEMVRDDLEQKLMLAKKAAKMMMTLVKQENYLHPDMEETLVRGLKNVSRDQLQTVLTSLRVKLGID